MSFSPSRPLTIDDLSSAGLERFGITIHFGVGPVPILHLCCRDSVLTAEPNERGNCSFVVPEHGSMPWTIFEAMRQEFDCDFERNRLMPAPTASSQEQRNVVTEMLGVTALSEFDRIMQYVHGRPHEIERGTPLWHKAEIAKVLVERNPELSEEQNSTVLLLLVQDAHERQDPPFKFMVRKRNPAAAKLIGQTLLDWVNEWEEGAQKAGPELV